MLRKLYSEEKIVKACKKGKHSAQKQLFDCNVPMVRGICQRYVSDTDMVEDVVQDVFVKVFTNISNFGWKGQGSLAGWISRIAINESINCYKKQKHLFSVTRVDECELELPEDEEFTSDDANAKNVSIDFLQSAELEQNELLAILQKVPILFRIVFNLYVIEGLSHREISDMLGIDEKTSRTRLLRARKVLQREVLDLCMQKMIV